MQDNSYRFYLISFFIILALPLLALPPWLHPAPWGKVVLFRIIISILTFIFLRQILNKKINSENFKFLLNKNSKTFWPFWLLVVFFAISFLAVIFSQNPSFSFWGSPYRAGGFLNLFLILIFSLLSFFIIKQEDWQKLWKFSLIIAVLVSLVAIMQYFKIFSQHLIPYENRPPSTFGNPIFLGIYLLILTFIALKLFLRENRRFKKILYLLAILIFLFAILITKTRAVYLGLLTGFLYFFIFYPFKNKRTIALKIIKIAAVFVITLTILGIIYINKEGPLPQFIENNKTLKEITNRFSFDLIVQESRFSVWKVVLDAIKEKPILGWGPENFSIAFDKHYNPEFSNLEGIWWDRAHNFILEIAVGSGLPALIFYLAFLAILFWQLQKSKKIDPQKASVIHTVQATFIGYLTVVFFNFDSFSTYLILFFLIAYSFYLINGSKGLNTDTRQENNNFPALWKSGLLFGLFFFLIIFIWSYCLKPFEINKDINWAVYYSENGKCQEAINTMENEVTSKKSIIDSYARLQYVDVIRNCLKKDPNNKYTLAPRAVEILREETKLRPNYTRAWTTLGAYLNILAQNKTAFEITDSEAEKLLEEADSAFAKAFELSPKREEMFIGWLETNLLQKKYKEALEKANYCISLNYENGDCWWKKSLAHIYLTQFKGADRAIKISIKNRKNPSHSKKMLSQMQSAYIVAVEKTKEKNNPELIKKAYEGLSVAYKKFIQNIDPSDYQQRASLAFIYKEIGEYRNAREQAVTTLKHSPESKDSVANFLDSILLIDNNYFEHFFAGAFFYYYLGNNEKALEQATIAQKYAPWDAEDIEMKDHRGLHDYVHYNIYSFTEFLKRRVAEEK